MTTATKLDLLASTKESMRQALGIGADLPFADYVRFLQLTPYTPMHVYRNAQRGVWLEPSDITTLYQDSFGTVPVTAVGDPIGLVLDKSQGKTISANIVVNGTFNTDTTGWTASSEFVSARIVDGKMYIDHTDLGYMYQAVPTIVGQQYIATGNFTKSGGGRFFIGTSVGDSSYYAATATTNTNVYFTATTTSTYISVGSIGLNTATQIIDNMAIRAIYGNPAKQTVSASRMTYGNTPNGLVLDKVDDALVINVPTGGYVGTMVLASDNGTASYDVNIPAGNYTLGGQYFPATKLVGAVFRHGAMTAEEKESAEVYFEGKGAVRSFAGVIDMQNYWRGHKITSFPLINTSNTIGLRETWRDCALLTIFPLINTSKVKSMHITWYNCVLLTSFPLLDTSMCENFQSAWHNCSSLVNFPPNMFNNIKGGNFTDAFMNTNLSQASIDGILVSLVTSGVATGTRVFRQSGGSAPSANGEKYLDTLAVRGWNCTVTGGYKSIGNVFATGAQGAWYDPSDLNTLFQDAAGTVPVTKSGDPVGRMLDKSGNGNHAVQTLSTARPLYQTDGILHWLKPDGVDDFFEFNGAYLVNSEYHVTTAVTFTKLRSFILAGKVNGPVGGNLHVGFDSSTTGLVHAQWGRDLTYLEQLSYFASPKVISASLNNIGKSIYINGALKASDTVSAKLGAGNDVYRLFNLVNTNYFNSNFYGMVIVNKTLDAPSLNQVTGYFAAKAGVTL